MAHLWKVGQRIDAASPEPQIVSSDVATRDFVASGSCSIKGIVRRPVLVGRPSVWEVRVCYNTAARPPGRHIGARDARGVEDGAACAVDAVWGAPRVPIGV